MDSIPCLPLRFATLMRLGKAEGLLPFCDFPNKTSWVKIGQIYKDAKSTCKKPCNVIEIKGRRKSLKGYVDDPRHVWFEYFFIENDIDVFEEYLIYDVDGMVGSIGGTLGLFIGFSFLASIKEVINLSKALLYREFLE